MHEEHVGQPCIAVQPPINRDSLDTNRLAQTADRLDIGPDRLVRVRLDDERCCTTSWVIRDGPGADGEADCVDVIELKPLLQTLVVKLSEVIRAV